MNPCSNYSYFNPAYYVCSSAEAFTKGLSGGVGQAFNGVGKNIGTDINKIITDLFKNINVQDLNKKMADDFDGAAAYSQDKILHRLDEIRAGVQKIFANMARDVTLKMLPWAALGGCIMIGTPLLVTYAYHKAKHNIGRPKLATETRYVSLYGKTVEGTRDLISALWESLIPGIKMGTALAASGIGASIAAATLGKLTSTDDSPYLAPAYRLLDDLVCALGLRPHYRYICRDEEGGMFSSRKHVCGYEYFPCSSGEYLDLFLNASLITGGLVSTYKLGKMAYNKFKKITKNEPKPVFHPDLSKAIDNITKSTYNLQKNGGFFQNVLLYGPGGTGKTMVSKVIARGSNMNYVFMSGGDLAQYIKRGEHVTELNNLFETAKSSSSPTIIFIDEAESLCRDRDQMDKPELVELLNAFLNHTGEQSKKIMLILATNRLQDLDPAVLSRMDHKLFIAPPALQERKGIINQYLPTFFSQNERKTLFGDSTIQEIARETEGFTGRALFKLLNTIQANKHASANNRLTKQMIKKVVSDLVAQEKRVTSMKDAAAAKNVSVHVNQLGLEHSELKPTFPAAPAA